MSISEFNSRRQEIYRKMVREAVEDIKRSGECARGRIVSTAKGIATKRFKKLENSVYGQ